MGLPSLCRLCWGTETPGDETPEGEAEGGEAGG